MPGKASRFILLALNSEHIEPRLLSSASGLCRRMDAGIDIVLVSDEERIPSALEQFMREMQREGIHCRLKRERNMLGRDIVRYANTHECISTVVIGSLGNWMGAGSDKNNDPWRKLDCPLVVAMPD
jgi:hypothetical protein